MRKNPKSHKRHRRTTSKTWSQLPSDILTSVFERLRFADFRRTKSVCSSWHSASRHSVPKNHIPWLIFFPEKDNNNNSCTLFNPEEKDELYKTKDLGLVFGNSVCKATYGSWFLMQDPMHNLYILNVFTKERINLPSVESKLGEAAYSDFKSKLGNHHIRIRSPVFWVGEKTKDYVVIWGFEGFCVVYAKKGDSLWKEIPDTSECFGLVYKDHKLYFSSFLNIFKIFDFTKDIPQQIFESSMLLYRGDEIIRICSEPLTVIETKLVLSVTGDILKVERIFKPWSTCESFCIYKVYSSSFFKQHQPVCSLGDETMLWDLGITVLANGIEGLKKNSIYFSGGIGNHSTEIFLFDLDTKKMKPLHKFDCSSAQVAKARWFLPSFKSKCF